MFLNLLLFASFITLTFAQQCDEKWGNIPPRSSRHGTVGSLPTGDLTVNISQTTHNLTYVKSIQDIANGPIDGWEVVSAWELNNGILRVKAILEGGNLVSIQDNHDNEYIWLNKEGATNYGAGSNAFPLQRGLILHGGIRLTAVTPEHGLYYDTDWDISFEHDDDSSSIILSIQDTLENRKALDDGMSVGQYSSPDQPSVPMSKYPVTDAIYTFKITLKKGENFVRLDASLTNTRKVPILSEIWLPQTYPITTASQTISHQNKRRIKDLWVYQSMIKDNFLVIDQSLDNDKNYPSYTGKQGFVLGIPTTPASWFAANANLLKPLDWPTGVGGILYDYPYRDGYYHGVSFGDEAGRGVAYVTLSDYGTPHYTKMWSWGNPALFNRTFALAQNPPLAAGRPAKEYYEPWGSRYNTAFFEPIEFWPGKHGWEAFIVPFAHGLAVTKTQSELQEVVDEGIEHVIPKLAR